MAAVEYRRYQGAVFDGERPHSALRDLLDARDTLVEVRSGGAPRVALGVPHHAATGVDRIAERRPQGGRVADENAVLYALVCFDALARAGVPCRLVVAAHATDHDPNKHADSPYCRRALAGARLQLLLECHGAGRRAPHDLELSAGRNALADPLGFARRLARALGPGFHLAAQTAPGVRAALLLDARGADAGASVLRFPALRTRSLAAAAERGVAALHLEAKLRFRTGAGNGGRVTASGRRLGRSLAASVRAHLAAADRARTPPTPPNGTP